MELLLIPLMAILARASGGGMGAQHLHSKLTWLPEALFALVIGIVAYKIHGPVWGCIGAITSYIFMQTGHGIAYHMGRNPKSAQGTRKQTLSIIVDPICRKLGWTLGERPYCYLFMGIKGALIGLAVAPWGLLMALLWPLAYDIGRIRNNECAEVLSGAAMGAVLCLALLY
jgi:hypothetical protein